MNLSWNKQSVDNYAQYDNSELDILHPVLHAEMGDVCGKVVADYGCGEGKLLRELADRGAHVHGYDISAAMIDASLARVPDATLAVIESGRMPVVDASLDAVVSNLTFMMVPTRDEVSAIFTDIARALRPGGSFVYCVTHPAFIDKRFSTYHNVFSRPFHYGEEGVAYQFVLHRRDGNEVTDEAFIDHHYSLETYLNLLGENGLSFQRLREVMLPGERFPPYLVVASKKTENMSIQ